MKKLIIFMIMIVSLFMTACDNGKDTTHNTTITKAKEIEQDLAPYMFICDGILHDTGNAIVLYEGSESLYDEKTILDGYVSIGDIVKEVVVPQVLPKKCTLIS